MLLPTPLTQWMVLNIVVSSPNYFHFIVQFFHNRKQQNLSFMTLLPFFFLLSSVCKGLGPGVIHLTSKAALFNEWLTLQCSNGN